MTDTHPRPSLTVEIAGRPLEFHPVDESPCRRACPAGIDVKRYVGQIASGDFTGALATIRKHMPFPSACGRICLHPCETECRRGEVDKPIAIMHLKRFVSDYETRQGIDAPPPRIPKSTGRKIAIIGSGPSGLTAAHDLRLMGHEVTVFERSNTPGGMLSQAIPGFRLPHSAILHDIDRILAMGINVKYGRSIQGDTGIKGLMDEGFDAVLIATGTSGRWQGLKGKGWIEGGDLPGVAGASEFSTKFRNGSDRDVSDSLGKVVVLGWGVHAIACARTAIRLGCKNVTWIVPILKKFLQPGEHYITQAIEEGVEIIELARPVRIENSAGRVGGVTWIKLEAGDIDHTGRIEYRETKTKPIRLNCNTVIDAAHFAPDVKWGQLSAGPWGNITVHPDTMATSIPGVFASGDVVSGPKSVVEAVSLGHRAAAGINHYFTGDKKEIGTLSGAIRIHGWEVDDPAATPSEVHRPTVRPVSERMADFHEAEQPLTVWQATHEARRCLMCGPCEECSVCLSSCYRKRGTIENESGEREEIRVPLGIARGIREETGIDDKGDLELYAAVVDPERCRGCGLCEEICGYHAPRVAPDPKYGFVSSIDILACKGCGTCVSACPSGAIDQGVTSLHVLSACIRGGAE